LDRKRRLPYQCIRWIESHHITMAQGIIEKQAMEKFKSDFIDCEVQMLSKTCTAVKKQLDRMNRIKK
jgi:hypothetical protein